MARRKPLIVNAGALEQLPAGDEIHGAVMTKAITIENPTATEDITWFFTPVAITVRQLRGVVTGSSPAVTLNVRHGTDRSASGASVLASNATVSDTTTGQDLTLDGTVSVAQNSWVRVVTSATSGTVSSCTLVMKYTED